MNACDVDQIDTRAGIKNRENTVPILHISLQAVLKYVRLKFLYFWRHKRMLNFANPTRFTELVQLRKLDGPNPAISRLIDKVLVKDFVIKHSSAGLCIPTYWHGLALPEVAIWPFPFIVKSRHGCNQYVVVQGDADWECAKRVSPSWVKKPYGRWLDEQYYTDVERGIIIEPFIGTDGTLPVDYKLYVFGGKVEFVQVHLHRASNHRWIIFDTMWNCYSKNLDDQLITAPRSLDTMIQTAQKLAMGLDFVRIDFYEVMDKPLFGEMTFYPGSGLDPFDPLELDDMMGRLWLAAKARIEAAC